MATINLQEPAYRGKQGPVFFAAGFRPFFLFAGIQAAVMLPLWLLMWEGVADLGLTYPPALWHGHEMVFGFGAAAVGGFLLTAVPSWANTGYVSGRPLMVLFALWLAGRAAFALGGVLPAWLVAPIDLAYLPLLAVMVAKPLIAAGKWRNIAFVPILALFTIANALVHVEAAGGLITGLMGVWLGIFILLLMIAIVGGRIVPSFTQNWLRMQGQPVDAKPAAWIEKGGAAAVVLAAAAMQIHFPGPVAGVALLLAAVVHGVRLAGWHGLRTLANPILWVLHLGYLWLVVGLALLGLANLLPQLPVSAAVHALTAGCIGTMVMAVMSRAALGHSGRPLELPRPMVAAYVLISLGTLLRVLAPVAGDALTAAGGLAWSAAWLVFVVAYWPIVTRPRADGRPG
ncbi:MAG: NnrS family protein [Magnetospirillum sp.]|nr:NnrS family protein [Magnetospirillum sp.]